MLDLRPAAGPRLVLQLSARDQNRMEVRVIDSPVGEAASEIALPALDDVQSLVNQPAFFEEAGRQLFATLFPGPVAELYRAAAAQGPLTVEMRFDRDLARIARYPWELVHDGSRFPLQAGAVNLARYVAFPEPPRPLSAARPIEVLVISSHPKDQPPLTSEFEALQGAFAGVIKSDQLDLAYLIPPTWDALMDWLLGGAPSVVHFEGHGSFDQTGYLIFESMDGESDPVDASTLGSAFYGSDLRLAVLSACDSSKTGEDTLLSSIAPSLILAGIPAVIAMQRRMPDDAAVRFSQGFYKALLAGHDIESAVAQGRRALLRTTYWYIPTLYLRARKTPDIRQAYLERRIDTAGPRSAPLNLPMRFGLWIRRPDSPPPTPDELRRLLGLEPAAEVSQDMTRAAVRFPVETGSIQPGLVEVRLVAPDCEIHTGAVKTMTVFPDFDTPPLWFCLTPRRAGRLDLIFELTQDGRAVASIAHTIQITKESEAAPVASVHSHTVREPVRPVHIIGGHSTGHLPPLEDVLPGPVAPAPQPITGHSTGHLPPLEDVRPAAPLVPPATAGQPLDSIGEPLIPVVPLPTAPLNLEPPSEAPDAAEADDFDDDQDFFEETNAYPDFFGGADESEIVDEADLEDDWLAELEEVHDSQQEEAQAGWPTDIEEPEAAKEEESEAAPPAPSAAPAYPAGPAACAPSPFGPVTPQEIVQKLMQIIQYVISLRNYAWTTQLMPLINEGDVIFIELQRIISNVENRDFPVDIHLQTATYEAVQMVINRVAAYETNLRIAFNTAQQQAAEPEPAAAEPAPEPEPEPETVEPEPPKADRVAVLLAALRDEKEWVQQGAAQALGELRDPASVEPLIAALADPNEKVRFYAAVALGLIGDGRAAEPIRRLLSDVNVNVRKVAEWALNRLSAE